MQLTCTENPPISAAALTKNFRLELVFHDAIYLQLVSQHWEKSPLQFAGEVSQAVILSCNLQWFPIIRCSFFLQLAMV